MKIKLKAALQRQQVGDGHFPSKDEVRREALTLTCTGLLLGRTWFCCIPDLRKARAVRRVLEGPVSTACPASLARRRPHARLYPDPNSASLLSATPTGERQ